MITKTERDAISKSLLDITRHIYRSYPSSDLESSVAHRQFLAAGFNAISIGFLSWDSGAGEATEPSNAEKGQKINENLDRVINHPQINESQTATIETLKALILKLLDGD